MRTGRNGTEILEVMLRYIASAAQDITGEKIQETLDDVLKDGGNIMSTLAQKWKQEGSKNNAQAVALRMMADGMPARTIAKYTGLSDEEIKELKSRSSTTH